MAVKINRPSLFGFSVTTMGIVEPRVDRFPVDPTSATIRWGDPVKQIAGGTLVRCTPADTLILGIAGTGQNDVLPTSIAHMPPLLDTAGRPLIHVYLADALNIFTGETIVPPTQSNVLQLHDFQYAIPDLSAPQPVVTNVGTAGTTATTYTVGALTALGETIQGIGGTTATGNANLTATNYNLLTIPAVVRAASFNIYRGGALIGTVAANPGNPVTFKDIGQAVLAGVPATVNLTGWLVNNVAAATGVLEIRNLDTKPTLPFINTANVGAVLFAINAAKSQVQVLAGA